MTLGNVSDAISRNIQIFTARKFCFWPTTRFCKIWVPRGSSTRAWKLLSQLFSRPDWLPLGLRGWYRPRAVVLLKRISFRPCSSRLRRSALKRALDLLSLTRKMSDTVGTKGLFLEWGLRGLLLIKTWPQSETTHETSLAPRVTIKETAGSLAFVSWYWRCSLEWFYLTGEIGSRILRTIMHQFHCVLLFTSTYFAIVVSICFTGQVNSLCNITSQRSRILNRFTIQFDANIWPFFFCWESWLRNDSILWWKYKAHENGAG